MNNYRRQAIWELIDKLKELIENYDPKLCKQCWEEVDDLFAEEFEYLESLSLSSADRCDKAAAAAANLSDAKECLTWARRLKNDAEARNAKIAEAIEFLEKAMA